MNSATEKSSIKSKLLNPLEGVNSKANFALAKIFDGYTIVLSWTLVADYDAMLYVPNGASLYKLFYASNLTLIN
jgi:hypothetical protein